MLTRMQQRRGTASQWVSTTVLAAGEVGFETDTLRFKIGDGTKTWANLPYYAVLGTSSTSASTDMNTFYGTQTITGNLKVTSDILVGAGASTQTQVTTNPIIVAKDTGSTYVQAAIINSAATGSSDFSAYADNGNDAAGWVDIGFTGSNFNDTNYTITGKNDGYVFTKAVDSAGLTGNLVFATGARGTNGTADIIFATGGFLAANERMRFVAGTGLTDSQLWIKSTTAASSTTTGALKVAGGAGIAGSLYAGIIYTGRVVATSPGSGTQGGVTIKAAVGDTSNYLQMTNNAETLQWYGISATATDASYSAGTSGTSKHIFGGIIESASGLNITGGTVTVPNTSFTYSKIQNVSAQYRVLGRISAAAGVIEELTPDNLITTLNQATTALQVGKGGTGITTSPTPGAIVYGASASALGYSLAGTAGQVLLSGGTGAPTWTSTTGTAGTSVVLATSPTFATSIDGSATFGAFASSTTLTLGYTGTASSTTNISTGAAATSSTNTINIGTGGASSSITNITLGSATTGAVGTTRINGSLAIKTPAAPITATTYTVGVNDTVLVFNTTAACTVTMPSAATYNGRVIWMKQIAAFAVSSSSSTGNLGVQPLTSVTPGTAILSGAGKFAQLVSNGTDWVIMNAN